jgi:uncharacterized protein (DUF427 family)
MATLDTSTPDGGRRITLEPSNKCWRALFAGHVIADTDDAVILHEQGLAPVVYFPRAAVAMEYMSRTDHHSHCPYKGDAAYYTLLMDGHFAENAVWTYERPIQGCEQIAGLLAFDPKQIEIYEIEDSTAGVRRHLERAEVDEIVQHTDAGDGRSQREHWPPNVSLQEDDGETRP